MKKFFLNLSFILFFGSLFAQKNKINATQSGSNLNTNEVKLQSYILPYVGITYQGSLKTQQTGAAHLRGDFNKYNTNFDLLVDVRGKSSSAAGYSVGFTYGNIWTKSDRKLNPGFEVDLYRTSSTHSSSLANPLTEEIYQLNGPKGDSVALLVEKYYGAGKHAFSNTMNMTAWNAAGNFILSYSLTPKVTLNGGVGIGFSSISLTNAKSFQTMPASSNSAYETTKDNGGENVNHYNSQPNVSTIVMFEQFRFGAKIQIKPKIAWVIDGRGMYRGSKTFNFGSTVYSDHPPTDNWQYTIGKDFGLMFSTGIAFTL